MLRTTTRRAVTSGLGALAATTALALAAPSATASTTSFVLDPGQGVAFSAYGVPLDQDLAEAGDATPVDLEALEANGEVVVHLPDRALAPGGVTALLVTAEDYEAAAMTDGDPRERAVELAEEVETSSDPDAGTLTVRLPAAELAADEDLDDVVLLVDGLEVEDFPGAVPPVEVVVPLDLRPGASDVESPALVDATLLDALVTVEEPVAARAGEVFDVVVPEESSLRDLGVEDLEGLAGFLVPLFEDGHEGADLVLEPFGLASVADAGAEEPAPAVVARALRGIAAEVDGSVDALPGTTALDVAVDDEASGDLSASVTPSEDLEEGTYLMVLLVPATGEVSVVALGELEVAAAPAAAPAPVPTVTVTAPATAPAPSAPVRQNPGLRSNTGVEGGGVDGGLLAVGAGLLAVAAVGGAAALRTGRRGRA